MDITLIGNKDGVYINPTNCNAYVDYTQSSNYKDIDVDWNTVNNLVIERNKNRVMKIIQVGGYNQNRGLFCDLY